MKTITKYKDALLAVLKHGDVVNIQMVRLRDDKWDWGETPLEVKIDSYDEQVIRGFAWDDSYQNYTMAITFCWETATDADEPTGDSWRIIGTVEKIESALLDKTLDEILATAKPTIMDEEDAVAVDIAEAKEAVKEARAAIQEATKAFGFQARIVAAQAEQIIALKKEVNEYSWGIGEIKYPEVVDSEEEKGEDN